MDEHRESVQRFMILSVMAEHDLAGQEYVDYRKDAGGHLISLDLSVLVPICTD